MASKFFPKKYFTEKYFPPVSQNAAGQFSYTGAGGLALSGEATTSVFNGSTEQEVIFTGSFGGATRFTTNYRAKVKYYKGRGSIKITASASPSFFRNSKEQFVYLPDGKSALSLGGDSKSRHHDYLYWLIQSEEDEIALMISA